MTNALYLLLPQYTTKCHFRNQKETYRRLFSTLFLSTYQLYCNFAPIIIYGQLYKTPIQRTKQITDDSIIANHKQHHTLVTPLQAGKHTPLRRPVHRPDVLLHVLHQSGRERQLQHMLRRLAEDVQSRD